MWVEPWLASERVSRRTSRVSKIVSCRRSIVLARLSDTASTSTVIWGVVSMVSRISWVRSSSTPSTLLISSPSLKARRWVALRFKEGPPDCLTAPNSGRWAASGMAYSSTGRSSRAPPSGVSTDSTNRIASALRPLAISSPGVTILPSANLLMVLLSETRCRVPERTMISRRMSFFWVTVTMPAVWLKMSFTTSVPASIHWPSSIINREISLLISWVSWGIHSRVPPLLTS